MIRRRSWLVHGLNCTALVLGLLLGQEGCDTGSGDCKDAEPGTEQCRDQ